MHRIVLTVMELTNGCPRFQSNRRRLRGRLSRREPGWLTRNSHRQHQESPRRWRERSPVPRTPTRFHTTPEVAPEWPMAPRHSTNFHRWRWSTHRFRGAQDEPLSHRFRRRSAWPVAYRMSGTLTASRRAGPRRSASMTRAPRLSKSRGRSCFILADPASRRSDLPSRPQAARRASAPADVAADPRCS
jgi:hypothetical protein